MRKEMQLPQIDKKIEKSELLISRVKKLFEENDSVLDQFCSEDYKKFMTLEEDLRKLNKIEEWNMYFSLPKNIITNNIFFEKIYFFNSEELVARRNVNITSILEDDKWVIFSLPQTLERTSFMAICFKRELGEVDLVELDLFLGLLNRTFLISTLALIDEDAREFDMLKLIFNHYTSPIGVISEFGEILFFNQKFQDLKILPGNCLQYRHQEIIEILSSTYQICRYPIEHDLEKYYVFIFYERAILDADDIGRHKEMGIISSSIAHELNNPLAGIMAATSLVIDEHQLSEEAINDLNELAASAKRCKDLVQIFLGFSKMTSTPTTIKLKDAFDQAMSLLRFRIVESKIRPEISYEIIGKERSYKLNYSILSMILYLILSEFLTSLSHCQLLLDLKREDLQINIQENLNQLQISFSRQLDFYEKIKSNKLILQLLEIEKIELVNAPGLLIFRTMHWSQRLDSK